MVDDADTVRLAVVGAHLAGEVLHHQLSDRGATLVSETTTAPVYRLFALATDPPKPGLVRVGPDEDGAAIEVEVWALEPAAFASFVNEIPAPLGIGRIVLLDGSDVAGFICEPIALAEGAVDITRYGGWRAFLAHP